MIERIGSPLNRDELEKINSNFEKLDKIDYKIMQDFLSADPTRLTPGVNGIVKPTELDTRNLNNYGINFRAGVNGIIYKVSIYANRAGQLGVGLAEQEMNSEATAELYYKIVDLRRGWNEVELNFPVEQQKRYTIFRRIVAESILNAGVTVFPWNEYPFENNGLENFAGGMFLDQSNMSRHYSTFFNIRVITSIAQVYKIANDSVKPPQQFYVGNNPPQDAQFWFKPVGED
ncbi:hypothetical protein [Oceanobacillus timonensis]|uniref:hypothetical protein n=1 Tax=Oceanobacillus timonensis TaxID=1926285 RepID=UPI0009BC0154|nr:hypothetical protein [Oceanobacillus timonensis]